MIMATSTIMKTAMQMKSITLPFTPPTNGLLLARVRAQSTGRAYVQLSNVSPNMADGYQVAGGFFETAHFASKGQAITVSGTTNVSDQAYWFVSLG